MSENLTTEDVREGFLLALTGMLPLIPGAEMIIKADFDAWLAEELRAAKEEAWEEGEADGHHNEYEGRPGMRITNPYRKNKP